MPGVVVSFGGTPVPTVTVSASAAHSRCLGRQRWPTGRRHSRHRHRHRHRHGAACTATLRLRSAGGEQRRPWRRATCHGGNRVIVARKGFVPGLGVRFGNQASSPAAVRACGTGSVCRDAAGYRRAGRHPSDDVAGDIGRQPSDTCLFGCPAVTLVARLTDSSAGAPRSRSAGLA